MKVPGHTHLSIRCYYAKQLVQVLGVKGCIINTDREHVAKVGTQGMMPQVMVLGYAVNWMLQDHTDLLFPFSLKPRSVFCWFICFSKLKRKTTVMSCSPGNLFNQRI